MSNNQHTVQANVAANLFEATVIHAKCTTITAIYSEERKK